MILFKLALFAAVCIFQELCVTSFEVESFELNRVDDEEITPFYDTIVFNDISDIMKDFQTNIDSTYDAFRTSESTSNENVEDLLSEYQTYLDKANERKSGRESKLIKNQAPLHRQDQLGQRLPNTHKYFKYFNSHYPKYQYTPNFNGLDYFKAPKQAPSHSTQPEIYKKPIQMAIVQPDSKKINNLEPRINDPSPVKLRKFPTVPSACICSVREFPCNCGCNECLLPFKPSEIEHSFPRTRFLKPSKEVKLQPASVFLERLDNRASFPNDYFRGLNENTLNIRLKVEIQLPNTDKHSSHKCNHSETKKSDLDDDNFPVIKVPHPYFNLPVPLNNESIKKTHKSHKIDIAPIQKVTIHKKKKSKNNSIKKHKKKPSSSLKHLDGKTIVVISENSYNESKDVDIPIELITTFPTETVFDSNATQENDTLTQTRTSEVTTEVVSLNTISGVTHDSVTSIKPEEMQSLTSETAKLENLIETGSETEKPVITESVIQEAVDHRVKRSLSKSANLKEGTTASVNISEEDIKTEAVTATVKFSSIVTEGTNASMPKTTPLDKLKKKKFISDDDKELLYWPVRKINNNLQNSENITKLIIDREYKKGKFNLSKEAILKNHTEALEKAVFGEVDWNDIDTVAPVFMSFVGKYLRGVLTFCSDTICHSMKCGNKTCLHRVCSPDDRHNHIGHCLGSNSTDSVASMESILDLPSNTVFEVVDILHDEMLGKIFGKATLCPSTKCITMSASKKTFTKIKCSFKELSPEGCC